MYFEPYQTQAVKNHRIDALRDDLQRLIIEDELLKSNLGHRSLFVTDQHPEIKPFTQPIVIQVPFGGRDNDYRIISDTRAVAKTHRETGELVGGSDFTFVKQRSAIIDQLWIDDQSMDLLSISDYPMRLFAALISENITRRMNLDEEHMQVIKILAAYYYITLHTNDYSVDERTLLGYSKRISRTTGASVMDIMQIIENIDPMTRIDEFVDRIKTVTQSERLNKLNVGMIYKMLGGIWFGANAIEQMAVAIEYPPSWVAMVNIASQHKGYQKTILAQMARRLDRKGESADHLNKILMKNINGDEQRGL